MKKFFAILLTFVCLQAFGQKIVNTEDFEVTKVEIDSTGKVRCFYLDFGYKVSSWTVNDNNVITEMRCYPNIKYYWDTNMRYWEVQDLHNRQIERCMSGFYHRMESSLGLDNIAPNNKVTAKYKGKEYTYIIDTGDGSLRITLNQIKTIKK